MFWLFPPSKAVTGAAVLISYVVRRIAHSRAVRAEIAGPRVPDSTQASYEAIDLIEKRVVAFTVEIAEVGQRPIGFYLCLLPG